MLYLKNSLLMGIVLVCQFIANSQTQNLNWAKNTGAKSFPSQKKYLV